MVNIVEEFENKQIAKALLGRAFPDFKAGDTLKIQYAVDASGRIQNFEGLCIARRSRGFASSFVVRKLSHHGVYIERYFPLYSPAIRAMDVIKRGVVRRAKLYYIRNLSGKAARIREKMTR